MPDSPTSLSRAGFAAVALVVLGLGLWAVFRFASGTEQHSFAKGVAPSYVQVISGATYTLAIRGGVDEERSLGVFPSTLRCSVTTPDSENTPIAVAAESVDTKATNQIATFVAPLSGRVHLDCTGLPAIFVDDAVDASPDYSGWALLIAVAALTIGLPLALSVARRSLAGVSRDQPS